MLLIDLTVGQVLVYAMNKSEKVGINANQRPAAPHVQPCRRAGLIAAVKAQYGVGCYKDSSRYLIELTDSHSYRRAACAFHGMSDTNAMRVCCLR